jgi:ATP-binding cassette subfamily F protein uup
LDDFGGCVLIVSHDRYFMDRLVDHVFAFEGKGVIKDYPGTYYDYREWKSLQDEEEEEPTKIPLAELEKSGAAPHILTKEEINKDSAPKVQVQKKLSFKLQHELSELEKALPLLEEKKKVLEAKLAEGLTDYAEIQRLGDELKEVSNELDEKGMRWLEIQEGE